MKAYDLLDKLLIVAVGMFLVLIGCICIYLIIKYIRIIADHALERRQAREEEAERIAKNIYGED